MADVEARREARRRRILENAENRIRKIANLQDRPEDAKHNLTFTKFDLHIETSESTDTSATNADSTSSDVLVNSPSLQKIHGATRKFKEASRVWILIILAVTIRHIVLLTEELTHFSGLHANKIFLPFLLYELIEIYVLRSNTQENSSILMAVLALNNVSALHANRLLKFFEVVTKSIQDLAVYFCSFVVVDYMLNILL